MFVQPLLLWKTIKYCIFWMCVCSLSYPACNVHAPYCHLWPALLYNIFPRYHKWHDFRKKIYILNIKCVLWFSLQLLTETFSFYEEFSKIWPQMYIYLYVKYPLFFSDFNWNSISSTDFEKYSNNKFHELLRWETRCFMWVDRQTWQS